MEFLQPDPAESEVNRIHRKAINQIIAALKPEEAGSTCAQQPQVMPCLCSIKSTGLHNTHLLFVKKSCPVHGALWQA